MASLITLRRASKRHLWEACAEIPPGQGMRMGVRLHRTGFRPAEKLIGRNGSLPHFQMLL
jgi:hypothetical protein